jgi:hypothetical protein
MLFSEFRFDYKDKKEVLINAVNPKNYQVDFVSKTFIWIQQRPTMMKVGWLAFQIPV